MRRGRDAILEHDLPLLGRPQGEDYRQGVPPDHASAAVRERLMDRGEGVKIMKKELEEASFSNLVARGCNAA